MTFHFNWLHVAILVGILLKVISSGGGWFDFMEEEARYENRRAHNEFEAVVWIFWIAVIVIVALALLT